MYSNCRSLLVGFGLVFSAAAANAAGLLTPVSASDQLLDLQSHHVRVVINNGFARTEVEQVFSNPNAYELEAIYSAPVPEAGALSELTIWAGERVLQGEVVPKEEADRIYEEEKSQGNEVGKADKNAYQNFEFSVYPVPASGSVRMVYSYYEPLKIDTGVGRYTYPLEEGGTDDEASAFWTLNDVVSVDFSMEVVLKSAYPVAKTRVPGYGGKVEETETGELLYRFESQGAILDEDFVFYYMLEENLPGRLEVLTYRENEDKPGTFMMVMTPGVDLHPLEGGADFVFALDVSGSMQGKLHTLASGVKKAIGQLKPEDRFRVVAFNNTAFDLNRGWVSATEANLRETFARLDQLNSNGGTNVYAGVHLALERLDADRVATLILVTDGVTNQGIVDPKAFYKLMHKQDLRFYGFLLGNSSNWPLMQLMCDASGGSYRAVSNSDDIIGEVMIAKNKIVYESMRHAEISIEGVNTHDVGDFKIGKIHYGDQLVLFGRYEQGGRARVSLKARINGQDEVFSTEIDFPELATAHPELERMWALDQVRKIQVNEMAGFVDAGEAKVAIRDIGVAYQIVTDETSMIALDDAGFARHGVERRNQERVAREVQARQAYPNSSGAQRVDSAQPMYQKRSHSMSGGGGALEPWVLGVVALGGLALLARKKSAGRTAKGVALAGLVALGLATGDRVEADTYYGPRWTDRDAGVARSESSIDQSIAMFWEVSEDEARVEPRRRPAPVVSYVPPPRECHPSGYVSQVIEYDDGRDTHKVDQRRNKGSSRGHFGFNLFNAIPVFDFVWGEGHLDETDSYSGRVRR
ncbi:Vault protein inter-alpha-trypsin [Verrucomicrobiia bacterium DG1235]|nr:Vault protein inter-alpha-trypsin [Verrucomicrobiae bacterium DG1235]